MKSEFEELKALLEDILKLQECINKNKDSKPPNIDFLILRESIVHTLEENVKKLTKEFLSKIENLDLKSTGECFNRCTFIKGCQAQIKKLEEMLLKSSCIKFIRGDCEIRYACKESVGYKCNAHKCYYYSKKDLPEVSCRYLNKDFQCTHPKAQQEANKRYEEGSV